MSDLELRDALADLADQVAIVDLLDRAEVGAHRRRQRRTASAVASSVVAVLAVIVGSLALSNSGGGHPAPTAVRSPQPSPASSVTAVAPLPLKDRLPAYLPPGVHLKSSGPGGVQPAAAAVYHAIYTVNHASIRFAVIDDSRLKPCPKLEPGTNQQPSAPCGIDTSWLYPFAPLAPGYSQVINGRTAHVANEGFGIQDIEWREGNFHYVLTSDRLDLLEGTTREPSGIPFNQLVRMAKSVPADPSALPSTPLPNPPNVSIPPAALNGYHRLERQLLDGNGASIGYSRGAGEFTIYLVPAGVNAADQSPINELDDINPARAKHQGASLAHLTIRGAPATGWTGPGDFVGLRCHIDGFTVGFLGRYGITLTDYQRIAAALHIIPHQPQP